MNTLQRITASLEYDLGHLPPGSRLPALRGPADKYQTCSDTLIEAFRNPAARSSVHTRTGRKGYFAGPREEQAEQTGDLEPSRGSMDRCIQTITPDLCMGKLGHRQYLPCRLELASRLGVSPPTLRRALKRMVDNGLLQQSGARYMLPSPSLDARKVSAIYVADALAFLASLHINALTAIRSIERTIDALGWGQLRWFVSDLSKPAVSGIERFGKGVHATNAVLDEIISREAGSLYGMVSRLDMTESFRPLFEQALRNREITARICIVPGRLIPRKSTGPAVNRSPCRTVDRRFGSVKGGRDPVPRGYWPAAPGQPATGVGP